MSVYVEAGYAVVGVTLSGYGVWLSLRTRSISRAVGPARNGDAGDAPTSEPREWR
ncbi:MAG TPA: hypothetical protein VH112_04180 [Acidimicrobiales bacterium]|nr:hypothetical protein [Acidimicrobiales bacterium]